MTEKLQRKEEQIFYEALQRPASQREAFIEKACGDGKELYRRVRALLRASDIKDAFLRSPILDSQLTLDSPPHVAEPGSVVGHYKLLEKIGEGGMAVVYLAEQQEPIRRKVAFKIIKLGMDTRQVVARFEAERQALAMMDHPNIARVFDAGSTEVGRPYFVMELVHGISITEYCDKNRLNTRQRLELFICVCHAVQHAHQKGIIHRDLKPSNVMVTMHDDQPVPKIIDFGIAKATHHRLTEKTVFTRYAHFIGTPAYMSPEQAQMSGLDVDTRTDIYSLGVLLYELLTGTTPFDAETLREAGYTELQRIICETELPRPSTRLNSPISESGKVALSRQTTPDSLRKSVKGDLDWIVMKCLEKDRTRRYETAHALAEDIGRHLKNEPILAGSPGILYRTHKLWRRRRKQLTVGAVVLALLAGLAVTALMYVRSVRFQGVQWATGVALPEIIRLVEQQDYRAAFSIAQKAKQHIPDDPTLKELWPQICKEYSISTIPDGATVSYREHSSTDQPWQYLGESPIENVMLPRSTYGWRIEKNGFQTHECVSEYSFSVRLSEDNMAGSMVWIDAWTAQIHDPSYTSSTSVEAPSFLIDRFEVTNEQFKAFVDSGGYITPKNWEGLEFVKDGKQLSWDEAMVEFRDKSGQAGPATWRDGVYPDEQSQHPVSGVSWFEAAAYARFVGKSLPTVHHWEHAACLGESLVIVPFSNFTMEGTSPVGNNAGMGRTGLYDMAGNVKEWCSNATGDSNARRYILGGGCGEPTYMFTGRDSQSPWDRSPLNGFRCMKHPEADGTVADRLLDPIVPPPARDLSTLVPFTDEEFTSLRALYEYDNIPLNASVEDNSDSSPFWTREKITFDAAYGGERVIAYLFLPRKAKAPYQTVVYFPGVSAVYEESFDGLPYRDLTEYVIMSGRSLMFPVYKGTYERPAARGRVWTMSSVVQTPLAYRDWTIQMAKDLSRSIDYLETRDDIDSTKIAYYGMSWGAMLGPIMLAVEDRLDTGVFVTGGLAPVELPRSFDIALYAQRVKVPVLMVNGKEDVLLPLKTSQMPLHGLLGSSDGLKEHKLYPGGHGVFGLFYQQIRGDVLEWLDRYLGPVQ